MSTRRAFLIDPALPLGLIANTAAILALSLGADHPELIGPPAVDGDGVGHAGITTAVLPVLAADAKTLMAIQAKARAVEGMTVIDVTETAQRAKAYPDYQATLATLEGGALRYFGLCLSGPDKAVRSLTGSLPLLGRG